MLDGFTILRKDCVNHRGANTWSSRWVLIELTELGLVEDHPLLGIPLLSSDPRVWFDPLCMDEDVTCFMDPDVREDILRDTILYIETNEDFGSAVCGCCHWEGSSPMEDAVYNPSHHCCDPTGSFDGYRIAIDGECFIKWSMEIDGDTASLVGTSRGGSTITYSCTDFNCIGQSTFEVTQRAAGFEGLPHHLCIVSVSFNELATDRDNTTCVDDSQECECCLDYDCGLPLYVTRCDGEDTQIVTLTREASLPCGVSDPGGQCDYFGGSLACPVSGSLYFLAYCTGTDTWNVKVYCLIAACYVEQSCSISNLSCECAGIHFTLSCTYDADCPCCDDCTVCEPADRPATVTVSITSACPEFNGLSFTMTYDVVQEQWDSGFVALPSGGTIRIYGVECGWVIEGSGSCAGEFTGSMDEGNLVGDCDPFLYVATDVELASAVGFGGCGCSEPVLITVTITE